MSSSAISGVARVTATPGIDRLYLLEAQEAMLEAQIAATASDQNIDDKARAAALAELEAQKAQLERVREQQENQQREAESRAEADTSEPLPPITLPIHVIA